MEASNGVKRFVNIKRGGEFKFSKKVRCKVTALIGTSFGQVYEIRDSQPVAVEGSLLPLDLTDFVTAAGEGGGGGGVGGGDSDDGEEGDDADDDDNGGDDDEGGSARGRGRGRGGRDGRGGRGGRGGGSSSYRGGRRDVGAPTYEDRDNRNLIDDTTNQTLDAASIAEIKSEGGGATAVIAALVSNSATFSDKTEFSQNKYLKRKQQKYMLRFRLLQCTPFTISRLMFEKASQKIGNIRWDTVAQLLSYAGAWWW